MFRIRHQISLFLLLVTVTAGCQTIATTGLALSNRLSGPANENGTPIPLHPKDQTIKALGNLEYRGGLHLGSEDKRFGGLSGLVISDDGDRFLAVGDKGTWVRGGLLYEEGYLTGAHDIEVAPMRGSDGETLEGKSNGDAESVIGDLDGLVHVSFERDHRVVSFDLAEDGFMARASRIALPKEVSKLRANAGLEGIARLKDEAGTLLIMSEGTTDAVGNFKGWLIGEKSSSAISLKPIKPFGLTDLAVLPGGDVLTLERRFSPAKGPGFQIRRIAADTILPGAVLDGPVLANAGLPWTVDNMEGLDIRINDKGETLLYIVSDNNFNTLQRTLLMMFKLNE
jgi:hypothetical protein